MTLVVINSGPNHVVSHISRYYFWYFDNSQHTALVIMPTYYEAMNIEPLIDAILHQRKRFNILVIDNNSPVGIGDLVATIASQTPRVQVHRRVSKLGLETAYMAGFKIGFLQDYSYIFEMDADFSHQPRYLFILFSIGEFDADMAICSQSVSGIRGENWPWLRKIINKGGNLYARSVIGTHIRDVTGGFECFRASTLQEMDLDSIITKGYGIQVELNWLCNEACQQLFSLIKQPSMTAIGI